MTTAATLIALIAGTVQLWPVVGWNTPNQHQADVDLIRQEIQQSAEDVKEFRDEWKCDELEEELIALLEKVEAGDDSIETQREIEKIRRAIAQLRCERFEY